MGYADAIRPIRNRMRKFEYASVLQQISAYLQVDAGGNDKHAPRLPWVAERLALWTLRDKPHLYGRVPMQLPDLIRCMNEAWNAMDTAIEWARQGNPIDLFVRSVLLAQAPHQTAVGFGAFARQIDLLNRLDPASRLSRALEASVGMATNDYLQLAVFFWFRDEGRIHEVFERSYWQVLTNAFGPSNLHSFLKTIFKSRESVCNEMGQADEDEWFQPNLLYRYPFVVHDRHPFFWGAPTLRRHFEYAFSDIVGRSEDPKVRQPFEDAFESYVGESLQRSGAEVLAENEVRLRFSVQGPCCDFALVEGDTIVLFEVKNKALAHTLPASASVRTYRSKLSATLVKAAAQLDNVDSHVLLTSGCEDMQVHQVVVTYGDLMLGSASFLFEGKSESDAPIVLSIDQLDRLIEAVRLKQCSFSAFFCDHRQRQAEPATRFFAPAQLLEHPPYRLTSNPRHIADIFNPLFEQLSRRLGADIDGGDSPIRIELPSEGPRICESA
ncbi:hypothetical protein [Paraburkholderia dilworthii]|uniref:Nuclease-related domain-containing protein n=1 Tax=Paraburkholderia dilworthii TaxID=948106 RepID=A0ABW9DII5_9BURK